MDHTAGFPQRAAYRERLQPKPTLDTRVAMRGASADTTATNTPPGKCNEKELMHGLNDRLAGFIEKVHRLEHHNHLLEREIESIRGKAPSASCLKEEYGPELKKLRQMILDITKEKHQIAIKHQNLEEELSNLRGQHELEARSRSDAERSIVVLKKDTNDAYQAKLQLNKKAQSLVDEIHFLKRNHKAEVSEILDHIQQLQDMTVKAHEFGNPGVTAALRDIRAQLEGHAVAEAQQVGETFRSQFARLTEAAESKREALKATQRESEGYKRQMQAKNIELDCAKGTREALEKQVHEVEDRHREEIIHYQNTINELENELINCKFDMSAYLREYQDLLNVKMALDVEILSYRKLLCGEEARLSTMSETHISLPYIYHQSPIYTLPCLSRLGSSCRRAEPQYKFVEEIITETTREIEMSEFEETGSEETEVGKDEQECTKRDRGSSEEVETDNKDSREEENEQMSDCQQNQVASAENSVNGGSDGDQASLCEKVERENGQKGKAAVDTKGDSIKDKNTQSKVLNENLDEEEKQQHKKVADNTKEEKEEDSVTVQKELSSKPEGFKSEVTVNGEPMNNKKEDAQKDSFSSVQVKKPADETLAQVSEESDKTQQLSSAVQVQDKETRDYSTKTKELSEIAPLPLSTTQKTCLTEQKEISKIEAAKVEEKVAKVIQENRHDSNTGQNKELSLKSKVNSLPELEDQKPYSGNITETGLSPNEKIATRAEIEEQYQQGPGSSQIQNSEQMEGKGKTNEPPSKSEKAESSESQK